MVRGHGLIHSQDLISHRAFMLPTTESLFHAVNKATCQSSTSSVQFDTLINTKGESHRLLGCCNQISKPARVKHHLAKPSQNVFLFSCTTRFDIANLGRNSMHGACGENCIKCFRLWVPFLERLIDHIYRLIGLAIHSCQLTKIWIGFNANHAAADLHKGGCCRSQATANFKDSGGRRKLSYFDGLIN